ncbi:MAG: ROK family protein [Phycisphaeraceae bacterium]|nr:ROK family protein [Phycisphaeraceae bacterium]
MSLPARRKRAMFELLAAGSLSRTELVAKTDVRRNTMYGDVTALLSQQLVRESDALAAGVGRPRTPLEIDDQSRHVLGVCFQAGRIEVGRFNLLGRPQGELLIRRTSARYSVRAAAELIARLRNRKTFAVGVAIPGFVDRQQNRVAFSMVFPRLKAVSLDPIREAAGDQPLVMEAESQAVAARWLLTHARAPQQDTLLIYFEDGALGAVFLVHGRPNQGCISGANELGHNRLQVKTRRCYCGGVGCLERICDSRDLSAHGLRGGLARALAAGRVDHPAIQRMVRLLGVGFANAINFTRASHVIIASHLPGSGPLIDRLISASRKQVLPQLRQRVRYDRWPEAHGRSAQSAAYLALTALYFENW